MKVLIDDGMSIRKSTGIGNYTWYLYNALVKNGIDATLNCFETKAKNKLLKRIKYLFYINSKKFLKMSSKYNIVHFTNFNLPIFKNKKAKYVVTIHDLGVFIVPKTFSLLFRVFSKLSIKHSLKHADLVLVISQSVKNEIIERFPKYSDKVTFIYPGHYNAIKKEYYDKLVFDSSVLNSSIGNRGFFLFVGTIESRKNISFIIDSYILFRNSNPSTHVKMVLAGRFGHCSKFILKKAQNSQFSSDIIFTGFVSTDDINKLYNSALGYIYAPIYEGFGSTQLECMSCGLPLVLSDISTNREVSREYGVFFELKDKHSLSEKMKYLISDHIDYQKIYQIGNMICKHFSWDLLVTQYIKAYKDIEAANL